MRILQLYKETKVRACGKEHIKEDSVLRVFGFLFFFCFKPHRKQKGVVGAVSPS